MPTSVRPFEHHKAGIHLKDREISTTVMFRAGRVLWNGDNQRPGVEIPVIVVAQTPMTEKSMAVVSNHTLVPSETPDTCSKIKARATIIRGTNQDVLRNNTH